ncbi:hypothetical protein PC129_g7069 [Phytophthora cactorum]|uniref:Uncharacterized protein n=1 Tax=Phytophthora cactorum TaxID=29920 RepID=A0A8T1IB27_9STRA|nr:hypothetical protein PC118_g6700 [Phytophthora cactorum]KAG3222214.1 hypothetical protein PC129_g7069 [Phytophthora cactorum]
MVRAPGSFGDSGFHRESQEKEEVPIMLEPRMDASSEAGSPTTLLNGAGSANRQSAGRSSADRNEEEDLLEEKPQPPPYASSGGTAGHDSHRDPPGEEPKKKKSKAPRKKLKVPADSDSESRDDIVATWSEGQLEPERAPAVPGQESSDEVATNKLDTAKDTLRLLQEAGVTAGSFEASDLSDLDLEVMQIALLELFQKLRVLVADSPTLTEPGVKTTTTLPPPTGSKAHIG